MINYSEFELQIGLVLRDIYQKLRDADYKHKTLEFGVIGTIDFVEGRGAIQFSLADDVGIISITGPTVPETIRHFIRCDEFAYKGKLIVEFNQGPPDQSSVMHKPVLGESNDADT